MLHKVSGVFVAVMGVLLAGVAVAADADYVPAAKFAPKAVRVGGVEVTPWLGLSVGNNSNVGLTSGAKTSSNFTLLNPNLNVVLPTHGQIYSANYSGNIRRFSGAKTDNYNDHNFGLTADNKWSDRLNTLVNADYIKGHDGRNALMVRNKEIWHTTGIRAMGHYGAAGAQGQFELAAGQLAKRYDSNNSGATQAYNHDRTDLTGTFFYKVAPATQMILEVGDAKFVYVDAASKRLDSSEQHYKVGVRWNATAKTTGSIKVGTMRKTFNLGLLPSGNSTVWDADVTWSPKTYSKFDASLHQRAAEYGGLGSFMISRDADFKWTHDWTGYVSSALSFGDGADTFQAANRIDKRQTYALKATYGFRSWLRAAVEYQHSKRNSTDARLSYTQSVSMLTLEGSL